MEKSSAIQNLLREEYRLSPFHYFLPLFLPLFWSSGGLGISVFHGDSLKSVDWSAQKTEFHSKADPLLRKSACISRRPAWKSARTRQHLE